MNLYYTHLSNAWYGNYVINASGIIDDIVVESGETSGEVIFRWYKVGRKVACKLSAYSESWKLLGELTKVITEISKMSSAEISVEDVTEILKSLGIVDKTPTRRPKA